MGKTKLDSVRFHVETEGIQMPHYNKMTASKGGSHNIVCAVFRIIFRMYFKEIGCMTQIFIQVQVLL